MIITGIVFVFISLMTMTSAGSLFKVDAQAQSATTNPNLAQGQTTQPPLQSTNPNLAQGQTTQPITTPFTILRNNQIENTGTANSGISGPSNSNAKQTNNDIVLLSQRYISERYSDRVVGEVLNNGSDAAEFVQITVSFYDSNGIFLDSVMTYTDPSTIAPGNRAPFTAYITSDTIKENSETYEFTLQWRDINGNDHSVRITGVQAIGNDLGNVDSNNNNNNVNRVGGSGGGGSGGGGSGNNSTLGDGDGGTGGDGDGGTGGDGDGGTGGDGDGGTGGDGDGGTGGGGEEGGD